ncbi:MAG: ornithine cyclodeaminase [Rhodospirillales bacterium]|nr:ornithine cyclodeaminase [Rhodospirillales bacterium]
MIYISTDEVKRLVTIQDAIDSLEASFAHWSDTATANLPRRRLKVDNAGLNVMAGAIPGSDYFGYRAYLPKIGYNTLILLSLKEKAPVAMIDLNWASTTRTGAATGVATRYMARADAKHLAVIGTGRQSPDQIRAVALVRKLERITVFSRDAAKRDVFAKKIGDELGVTTVGAASAEACVEGADIVVAATNSTVPVLKGAWLKPGMHVNGIGANGLERIELDDECVLRADQIVTDQVEQAKIEAAALVRLAAVGKLDWSKVVELGEIVEGTVPTRTSPDQITLFHSLGIAFEDVAFGAMIYERAKKAGLGTEMPR